jgi:hypothetical protein
VSAVLLRLAGTGVLLVTLADIFFTVLFPATGHGPLRRPLSYLVWHAFRGPARTLRGRRRRDLLAYAGPTLAKLYAWDEIEPLEEWIGETASSSS